MTLHLIKLSVGPESLADLVKWQQQRLKSLKASGHTPELVHVTRQTPKRDQELLDGGSIYWVIKGILCGRQRLLELRPMTVDGVPHCGLVCAPEMITVKPRMHRPFQGWRYLSASDAPPDMKAGSVDDTMPEDMRRELVSLGLL